MASDITLAVALTEDQAAALAQYLKRVLPEDIERRTGDEDEYVLVRSAFSVLRQSLEEEGFAPR